ncbi:MAG TPA: hypothetical protein VH062_13540 [Polyangiaceae bacterium]|jgi:hypothetical protein|nr:hypothetical protein [Polyangiaceae bacterium]
MTKRAAPDRDSARDTDALIRAHGKAAYAWVASSLVYFFKGTPITHPPWIATALPFRSPSGRVILLTALHCVDEIEKGPHALGYADGEPTYEDALASTIAGPEGVDVALALLRPGVDRALLDVALDPGLVAASTDAGAAQNQYCIIAGFPYAIMKHEPFVPGIELRRVRSITHGTTIHGIDDRCRLRADWNTAVVQDIEPEGGRQLGLSPGQRIELPAPQGISGGALWRFTGQTPTDVLWVPQKRAHLIGIPTAFLPESRIELCESVAVWGDWFREKIAAL